MKIDGEKIMSFISELEELEKKHGIHLSCDYKEEIDYDYDESPYASGVTTQLLLTDESGFSISLDDIKNGVTECLYCGRWIYFDEGKLQMFCNDSCKIKHEKVLEKRKE